MANASGDVKPPNYGDLLDLPNNNYDLTDLTIKNGDWLNHQIWEFNGV